MCVCVCDKPSVCARDRRIYELRGLCGSGMVVYLVRRNKTYSKDIKIKEIENEGVIDG